MNVVVTYPSPVSVAAYVDPGRTVTIGPSAPLRITSPTRSGSPKSTAVRASQRTASSGLPRQAPPLPTDRTAARRVLCQLVF
jgi:hypothetical protein